MRFVIRDIFPAAGFLLTAEDNADSLIQFDACIQQIFHGVNRSDCRSLIVNDAASVQFPIFDYGGKGSGFPAAPWWNNVQMNEDSDERIPFSDLCPADSVIAVFRFKTQCIAELEYILQRGEYRLSVRKKAVIRILHRRCSCNTGYFN